MKIVKVNPNCSSIAKKIITTILIPKVINDGYIIKNNKGDNAL